MSTTQKTGLFSYENRLMFLLFLVFGMVFLDRLAVPFLWPFINKELPQLTEGDLGLVSSALGLTWALAGIGLGFLSDKFNMRKPLLVGALLVLSIFSALSGSIGTFLSLFIFRLVMGAAEGPVLPLSQSYMAEASQAHRRGLNMGMITGVAPGLFAGVFGPFIMITMAMNYGWRNAFYLSAIPGVILAYFVYRTVRDGMGDASEMQAGNMPHGLTVKNVRYIDLFRIKNIALCVLIACFFITWFLVTMAFLPTFLIKSRGFSIDDMRMIMMATGIGWAFWSLIVPWLSDKLGRKPVMVFFTFVAASCPWFILHTADPKTMAMLVVLTFTGIGCFTLFMATIPSETVSKTLIATALGLIMGTGEIVGGAIMPAVAGKLAESMGSLDITLWIAMGGAVGAGILALFLDETAPVKVKAKQRLAANK